MIEARGIATLVIGTAHDIMSRVVPPRAAFIDHPVARTFGPPNERPRNELVLKAALDELARFTGPGEIRDVGCSWLADGSRSWEDELRAEMAQDR